MVKNKTRVSQQQVEAVFDGLQAVDPDFMLGRWASGYLNTGHHINDKMDTMKWAGKAFNSVDDVDPVLSYNECGERVPDAKYGKATLKEVKLRGVVTAAMVYDSMPIIDGFKKVTDDIVLGMMDTKAPEYAPAYFFYLERLK
ncbi:hypothetical protein PT974_10065 [Cladobotryum mycophilum]|uniref:GXWXG domain-containing protein n=1 Tax=Cladobotryum mycophilum TaxID=491253 RepID=A0ABR0SA95_9HYPO